MMKLVILLMFAFGLELIINSVYARVPTTDKSVTGDNAIQEITIVEAKFEALEKGTDGLYSPIESNQLPLREGVCYGWKMKLITLKEEVPWKEELILPSMPKTWENIDEFTLSKDMKIATTKGTVTNKTGWISNEWCVNEGDPTGEYVMKVYLENTLVEVFKFWFK